MKPGKDELARQLESELGAGSVTTDAATLASHSVDGTQAAVFCSPETTEQLLASLRLCSDAEAAITPWGGGTAIVIGNSPRRVDVVIKLNRLNRLVEHDAANLTATVEAGISLSQVQGLVGQQNQFLAFDVPVPDQATVAGTIAANLNGPRRSCYGSVRDLVIGMKVALITGEHIKAGGKVVKNVAGYDMCKLFVGSLGTLGIITEATLRMSPLPETAATLIASGALPQVLRTVEEVRRSQLNPTAVFILNPQGSRTAELPKGDWHLAFWSEGFAATVARHIRDVQTTAERIGLSTDILRDQNHHDFWDHVRAFPLQRKRVVYRLTVPPALVVQVGKEITGSETHDFHPEIVSDASVGTVWIAVEPNHTSAEQFPRLIALAREHRGHAVMFSAPPHIKKTIDVWGPAPESISLMREIKRQFDPKGLLNPGRFLAGL